MISLDVVHLLLKEQFPHLIIDSLKSVDLQGHDNTSFDLNNQFIIKFPNMVEYSIQPIKEFCFLPQISSCLSLSISFPMYQGKPSSLFPYYWNIYKKIEGVSLTYQDLIDRKILASQLALFLKEFQTIEINDDILKAGEHNFYRGASVLIYNDEVKNAVKKLDNKKDLLNLWEKISLSSYKGHEVLVHGDIAVNNLLIKHGKLSGIIDFGMLGKGDPSCDYSIAWSYLDEESREIFFNILQCDINTKNRSMAWALWKALISPKDSALYHITMQNIISYL